MLEIIDPYAWPRLGTMELHDFQYLKHDKKLKLPYVFAFPATIKRLKETPNRTEYTITT